jgi:folate-binding protein YgfZ
MVIIMNYNIFSRSYTSNHSLPNELNFKPESNYLFDLDYLTVLSVHGEKRIEFLQGQLSCDLRQVLSSQMQQGALCNTKGRILAMLDVVSFDNQEVGLVLPIDLNDDTLKSLSLSAMLSRVQLRPNPWRIFGFWRQNQTDITPFEMALPQKKQGVVYHEGIYCYQLIESFYIFIVPPQRVEACCAPFVEQEKYRGSLAWHSLQIQQLAVEIYPETKGHFLPHQLNLEKAGYINFDKGCYKGQEIIARMHYRSTKHYQLSCHTLNFATQPTSSIVLHTEEAGPILGELVDYCYRGDGQYDVVVSQVLRD